MFLLVSMWVCVYLLGDKTGLGSSWNDTKQYHSKGIFTKLPFHQQSLTGLPAFLPILARYCLFQLSYSRGWVLISHCAAFGICFFSLFILASQLFVDLIHFPVSSPPNYHKLAFLNLFKPGAFIWDNRKQCLSPVANVFQSFLATTLNCLWTQTCHGSSLAFLAIAG